jgi:hypothetical protein
VRQQINLSLAEAEGAMVRRRAGELGVPISRLVVDAVAAYQAPSDLEERLADVERELSELKEMARGY